MFLEIIHGREKIAGWKLESPGEKE